MAQNAPYLYQLQGADYASLSAANFKVSVTDYEQNHLTRANVSELSSSGKTLYSYLSIGEAEDYRSYWTSGDWDNHPPSFLLGENPDFDGAFRVKFWDPTWQNLVFQRLDQIVKMGYEGAYFDVVDAYKVPEVVSAYNAAKPGGDIMHDMEDFVVALSVRAKLINPDFKIIPQNAPELLNIGLLSTPTSPLTPNTRFLNAIDGFGKESTFTAGNTYPVSYTEYDRHYIENALNAGKFVLGIEYPTDPTLQQTALDAMVAAGYIPFIGTRDLDGNVASINGTITVDPTLLAKATGDSTTTLVLVGSNNAEVRLGNAGNDSITMNDGNDTAFGHAGNDWISLGLGNDMGYGGSGNDTIFALEGDDTVSGDSGNDVIYGWYGDDSIEGADGNDFVTGDFGNDTLIGGDGDDGLYGWTGTDSLVGGDGNDFLMSEQDEDTVSGGAGNDTVYAGSERDTVDGGTGEDYILGDAGNDTINAGAGNDTVFGGPDNDTVRGGDDNDFIGGDDGTDQLFGENGNDILYGWLGNDTLDGGAGNDLLSGEGDNDQLLGGTGDDTIYGGDGNDSIQGNADSGTARENQLTITAGDLLIGGDGGDVFVYQKNSGVDRVLDFTPGVDKIQLVGFGSGASFATTVQPHTYYISWDGAWIFLGQDQGIILQGVQGGQLSASDFAFF